MGNFLGSYTRHMFDEGKRYVQLSHQDGVALVDADLNDGYRIFYRIVQNAIRSAIGDSAPNAGFKIVGTGATNDFTITGGDGTIEGAGIIASNGHMAYLLNTIAFKDTPVGTGSIQDDRRSIHAKITAVSSSAGETTITDSSANYSPTELIGRFITPDAETPANSFQITSNTSTQIVVAGDQTGVIAVGNRYRLELSTPTGARTDGVYLNIFLDEIDSIEDANLLHTLDISREAALRLRLEQSIFVREDTVTHGEFVSYSDSELNKPSGLNKHFVVKLATINRLISDATITTGMVTDNRTLYNSGHGLLTTNPHSTTLEQARTASNVLAGQIDMGTSKIINAGTPTLSTDLSTKSYVDSFTPLSQVTMTANATASSTDSLIFADATAATFTITLPDPTTLSMNKTYRVKKSTVTNDVVIVSAAGLVEGAANYTIAAADGKKAVMFAHDGTNWHAISSFAG